MRPGDTGIDHAVTAASILILSPADGSVLAAVDLAGESGGAGIESAQPGGKMLYPFVYLTAFSRGLSPGSMVLDLPTEANAPSAALAQYHGPERMRTALANGDRAATVRAIDLAGAANIRRTLQELGLIEAAQSVDDEMLADGSIDTSLLDLSYSYSTLANQGLMVSADLEQPGPSLVRSIQDRFERSRYDNQRQTKVVLGEGLSYLLLDVLTDESAADVPTSLVGTSTIGRPVGWLHAETGDGTSWSVLFTPSLLVGVRIDSEPAAAEKAATVDNASDPLATAVMRYASSDRTPAGWVEPPEVEEVEVCDPSGLLPTEYCPEVVREVFLQGTEPSALDNLYQPFRVNRETGRLATLQTPLELIEERVYLVPPPEAAQWASQAGIQQPPTEYDPLSESASDHPDVTIESPNQFATVGGEVVVRGQVHPDDLDYYRLQVGRGLNPTRWTQIGSDSESRAWGGVLAKWDTSALSGLYTLQLVAVLQNGQIISAAAPVTIDNQPPAVAIRRPTAGAEITGGLTVEVDVEDDSMIDWVDVYLDGRKRARLREAPYAWEGSTLAAGEHVIQVRAADIAGNQGESALLQVQAGD
jgi:membrane peptidoglycan carboxypeptidase